MNFIEVSNYNLLKPGYKIRFKYNYYKRYPKDEIFVIKCITLSNKNEFKVRILSLNSGMEDYWFFPDDKIRIEASGFKNNILKQENLI